MQGLKVIIDCPQPGSSRATYRRPPIGRWSKCGGNDTVMVGTSKVPKETQPPPEWLEPALGGVNYCIVVSQSRNFIRMEQIYEEPLSLRPISNQFV